MSFIKEMVLSEHMRTGLLIQKVKFSQNHTHFTTSRTASPNTTPDIDGPYGYQTLSQKSKPVENIKMFSYKLM